MSDPRIELRAELDRCWEQSWVEMWGAIGWAHYVASRHKVPLYILSLVASSSTFLGARALRMDRIEDRIHGLTCRDCDGLVDNGDDVRCEECMDNERTYRRRQRAAERDEDAIDAAYERVKEMSL